MFEFKLGEGFPKSLRLLTSGDFNRLKTDCTIFQNSLLRVYSKAAAMARPHARFGFAISKKVGKAHDRNRLKRIMRDYLRRHELRALSCDFLFVVSPRTLRGDDPEENELKFKRALAELALKISTSKRLKS